MPLTQQEQDELELLQLEEEEHQHQLSQEPTPVAQSSEVSGTEAAALGAVQGATLGFGDELEGAVRGGYNRLVGDEQDLGDAYRKFRDIARTRNADAQAQHGGLYMGGEVAGGLGTLLVPGVGAANLTAKGAALAGAGMGAASGLGTSEADLTTLNPEQYTDAAKDVALGAGVGGALGAAGYGLTKALPKVAEGVQSQFKAGKRVAEEGRTILGEEAEKRINKEVIDASKLVTETGEKLQSKLGKDLGAARKGLGSSDQGKYTDFLDTQIKKIDDFIASKKGSTAEDFPELSKMRGYLDRLRNGAEVEKQVPYAELKSVPGKPSTVKKLQEEASKLSEQAKLQGEDATFNVIETADENGKKFASLVKTTRGVNETVPETLVPLKDANGEAILDELGRPAKELQSTGESSIKQGLKVKTLPSEPEIPPSQETIQGFNKVKERLAPNLTPSGEDVAGQLQDVRGLTENVLNKENLASAKDVAVGVRSGTKDFMENLSPEIAATNSNYKNLMDLDRTFGSVVGSGEKGLVGATKEGDYLKDSKQLRNYIENLGKETQGGRRAGEQFSEELEPKVTGYVKQLRDLATSAKTPEEAAEFSKYADNLEGFLTKAQNAGEDVAAREGMKSSGLMGIPSLLLKYGAYGVGRFGTARGVLKAGEKVIEASPQATTGVFNPERRPKPEVKENKSPTAKTSQNVYNLNDDELMATTDAIRSVRPEVADKLMDAIQNGNQSKKRAMQFVIAQDPKLRSLFNS